MKRPLTNLPPPGVALSIKGSVKLLLQKPLPCGPGAALCQWLGLAGILRQTWSWETQLCLQNSPMAFTDPLLDHMTYNASTGSPSALRPALWSESSLRFLQSHPPSTISYPGCL